MEGESPATKKSKAIRKREVCTLGDITGNIVKKVKGKHFRRYRGGAKKFHELDIVAK